jgi:hypothetical protein
MGVFISIGQLDILPLLMFSVLAVTCGRPLAISLDSYNVDLPIDCENDRIVPLSCSSNSFYIESVYVKTLNHLITENSI